MLSKVPGSEPHKPPDPHLKKNESCMRNVSTPSSLEYFSLARCASGVIVFLAAFKLLVNEVTKGRSFVFPKFLLVTIFFVSSR